MDDVCKRLCRLSNIYNKDIDLTQNILQINKETLMITFDFKGNLIRNPPQKANIG